MWGRRGMAPNASIYQIFLETWFCRGPQGIMTRDLLETMWGKPPRPNPFLCTPRMLARLPPPTSHKFPVEQGTSCRSICMLSAGASDVSTFWPTLKVSMAHSLSLSNSLSLSLSLSFPLLCHSLTHSCLQITLV